jgi:DNA-binding XRE family transcriptional regulator
MKSNWSKTVKLNPDHLRKLRNDKGLKQASLADDVRCDQRTIQRAEAGEKIKRHIAVKISAGCSYQSAEHAGS